PEPSIDWQQLIAMRVDKAVDEHGQALKQPTTFVGRVAPLDPLYGNSIIDLDVENASRMSSPWLIPAHLKLDGKPAKRLTELRGTITGRILAPREAIITVDNILESAGKTFNGPDSTSLKIMEARRLASGTIVLRVQGGGANTAIA